uniref:CCHC-type domain-containing protein n=1 Tax=Xiphophorus maculatus TaxID=8083 RepID=A0A3B5QH33_XIPMA
MDPTEQQPPAALRDVISRQGVVLGQSVHRLAGLEAASQSLHQEIAQLASQVEKLTLALSPSPGPSGASAAVAAAAPPPASFPAEPPAPPAPASSRDLSKIYYVMGLLRDQALAWALAFDSTTPLTSLTFKQFTDELSTVFDHPDHVGDASKRLLKLRQGSRSAAEFSVEFRTLAADTKWNDEALKGVYYQALTEALKDGLSVSDEAKDLNSLITMSIRLDNRLRERRRERSGQSASALPRLFQPAVERSSATPVFPPAQSPAPAPPDDEPMQIGRTHLTATERQRRLQTGDCLYCGKPGHRISSCPVRPKDKAH